MDKITQVIMMNWKIQLLRFTKIKKDKGLIFDLIRKIWLMTLSGILSSAIALLRDGADFANRFSDFIADMGWVSLLNLLSVLPCREARCDRWRTLHYMQ